MPIKVTNNTKETFFDIKKKVEQFRTGVVSIGATLSMSYAPLEFGDLRASQRVDTWQEGGVYYGSVSFGAGIDEPYPEILENSENWKPRPPSMKAGHAWNPDATPHYLQRGFEGSEAVAQIGQLKRKLIK